MPPIPGRRATTTAGAVLGAVVVLGAAGVAYAGAPSPSAPASPPRAPAGAPAPAHRPHLDGVVVAVQEGHLTIKDPDGFTRRLSVSKVPSGITTGTRIHAEGAVASDGVTLDATTVVVAPVPSPPGHRPDGARPPAPARGGPAGSPAYRGKRPNPPAGGCPQPPAPNAAPAPSGAASPSTTPSSGS